MRNTLQLKGVFGRQLNLFLTDKQIYEKIKFSETEKVLEMDTDTEKVLNNFSSNVVQNLATSRYIKHSTLKATLRYRNHPSIVSIQSKHRDVASFNFVSVADTEEGILNVDKYNASENPTCKKK